MMKIKNQLASYNNDRIEKCKLMDYESYRFIRYHDDFLMIKQSNCLKINV